MYFVIVTWAGWQYPNECWAKQWRAEPIQEMQGLRSALQQIKKELHKQTSKRAKKHNQNWSLR